jgi:hypothetical protein
VRVGRRRTLRTKETRRRTESLSLQLGRHGWIEVDEPLLDDVDVGAEVRVRGQAS